MVKYLSGRQKLRPSDKLTEDRYQYLGLDQAEPNLADPATSPGVPSGLQYQLVAVTGYEGRRYWVPVGGSLQPGAITIFDEGTPVSSASSITQMNFVGAAVTAQVSLQNPSGHPGIAATVTVIPVTVGDSPPIGVGATNNGELWWESDTGDLYVYYNDGNSSQWVMANAGGRGLTGDKGEKGEKGQKGDTGLTGGTGQKGEVGEKGAPSTVAGPAGDKGQKGEIGAGDKGQKGEDGSDGAAGDKGQKGEIGVGNKGDKGEGNTGGAQVTISDTAPTSPTPSNGDLWWESDTFDLHVYYEDGSSNQWVSITSNAALKGEKGDKGQKGEIGDKGQKGEVGTDANLPVATIVAYGGSSAPSGWQICNGGSSSTSALQAIVGSNVPDLRNRFIVGAGSGGNYSPNDTGGSADAVLVSHTHNLQNHVHGVNITSSTNTHNHGISDPGHFHTTNNYVARSNYAEPRNFGVGTDGNLNSTGDTNSKTTGITINNDSHSHTVSGNTGTPSSNTTDTLGESATNKNLPPYYALIYIIKT